MLLYGFSTEKKSIDNVVESNLGAEEAGHDQVSEAADHASQPRFNCEIHGLCDHLCEDCP